MAFTSVQKPDPFYIGNLVSNPRSKQNKKNPNNPVLETGEKDKCTKFQQKMLNSMDVGATQSFKFSNKIPGFSKTIELCVNFFMVKS